MTTQGRRRKRCCLCTSLNTVKNGFYRCKNTRRKYQRYLCHDCKRGFSAASNSPRKYQKLRNIEPQIEALLCAGVSEAETARQLKINPKTIVRRLPFIHAGAEAEHKARLEAMDPVKHVQLDELITFEHTRLKQVSVPVVVDSKYYYILGTEVARIPTSGTNAALARKKYGHREDESEEKLNDLLAGLASVIDDKAHIKSDKKLAYEGIVETCFPTATHTRHKGRRSCNVGQGELKGKGFDPIFPVNHILATLRYRCSRLIRRTWNTTKKLRFLRRHLDILVNFYNRERRPQEAAQQERKDKAEAAAWATGKKGQIQPAEA